jgi:hypothetical protein
VSGQLHAPATLPSVKEPPVTHCVGGWVDPRAGLDGLEKRKFLTLLGLELRPLNHPACCQLLYWLHYPNSYFLSQKLNLKCFWRWLRTKIKLKLCNGRNDFDTSGNFVIILQLLCNALHLVSAKVMSLEYFARMQNLYTFTFLQLAKQVESSNNGSDPYLWDSCFRSWLDHWVSWLRFFVVLLSPSRQIPG